MLKQTMVIVIIGCCALLIEWLECNYLIAMTAERVRPARIQLF